MLQINMSRLELNNDGYFGAPTSTIDWCEANYEVTYYIAEFWNTVSNVTMIIPPLLGAIVSYCDKLESHYVWCHLALLMVGLGSWGFHGTLLYELQLMDELPMIWGSAVMIYALMQYDQRPKKANLVLGVGLTIYCLIVTVVYITIKEPVFHEAAYAVMVFSMIGASIRIVRNQKNLLAMFVFGLVVYGMGFIIWNLDHQLCHHFRSMRSGLGYPLKPVLQGHAWWHVFAGVGTYTLLLFCTHARCQHLKVKCEMKMAFGIPVLRVKNHAV